MVAARSGRVIHKPNSTPGQIPQRHPNSTSLRKSNPHFQPGFSSNVHLRPLPLRTPDTAPETPLEPRRSSKTWNRHFETLFQDSLTPNSSLKERLTGAVSSDRSKVPDLHVLTTLCPRHLLSIPRSRVHSPVSPHLAPFIVPDRRSPSLHELALPRSAGSGLPTCRMQIVSRLWLGFARKIGLRTSRAVSPLSSSMARILAPSM